MRPSLLTLLGGGFGLALAAADPFAAAIEAAPLPNPAVEASGFAVTRTEPQHKGLPRCDREIPPDEARLRLDGERLCYETLRYRAIDLTARDPDPEVGELWFVSDRGESGSTRTEGVIRPFTDCLGADKWRVVVEVVKGCVKAGGVLDAQTTELSAWTRVALPSTPMGVGPRRRLWTARLRPGAPG